MLKYAVLALAVVIPSISIACAEHEAKAIKDAYAKIDVISAPKKNNDTVKIRLSENSNGKPISMDDLKEAHTKKLHVMLIDPSLTDYKHVHPTETKTKGVYEFKASPTKYGYYKGFADIVPVATDKQEFVRFTLGRENKMKVPVDTKPSYETTQNGYNFKLEFEDELKADKDNIGKVTVTKDGKEFTDFEEIMGAKAHIAAFSHGGYKLEHLHNIDGGGAHNHGHEHGSKHEHSANNLSRNKGIRFELPARKAGFTKVFVEVKINGKEVYAPFGVEVK